jgi:hypothetical protein
MVYKNIKKQGIIALSILLIVALVVPQVAFATGDSVEKVEPQPITADENPLENNGGGGRR